MISKQIRPIFIVFFLQFSRQSIVIMSRSAFLFIIISFLCLASTYAVEWISIKYLKCHIYACMLNWIISKYRKEQIKNLIGKCNSLFFYVDLIYVIDQSNLSYSPSMRFQSSHKLNCKKKKHIMLLLFYWNWIIFLLS